MGTPPQAFAVYEPHLSVGDRHVTIRYVGYPAVAVFERILGSGWRRQGEAVEFRALDGYVSRLPVSRFLRARAYLVFARQDGAPFTVNNLEQNEKDVPLAPWYLVWDNIANPALIAEGARNWPYQVKEIRLVALSDRALLPKGLEPRFRPGAALVKTHCLQCHKVNGYGGEKFAGNLAEIAKDSGEADFLRLLLIPAAQRDGATMPALSDRLPEAERRRIAGAIFDYLRAVPVLPSGSLREKGRRPQDRALFLAGIPVSLLRKRLFSAVFSRFSAPDEKRTDRSTHRRFCDLKVLDAPEPRGNAGKPRFRVMQK